MANPSGISSSWVNRTDLVIVIEELLKKPHKFLALKTDKEDSTPEYTKTVILKQIDA